MKFDVMERDIESSVSISTKKITLSANAKAFKIIFGQIYPDIIKAIVRELFTNAWDSQKVAGTLETPIDIHLPTKWEPFFSIRDYGTGMTPQVVDDIYSKVFESSKDASNEEAGMFGMGSKTPLGYTDSFTIMSYVDGKYYAYDIYIGKGGDPVIDLKATGECDEPNGVEVSLGVREEDFDQFKNYAEHFAVNAGTPININRQKVLVTRKPMFTGDGWEMFSDKFPTYIRMGCVLYQLDANMITRDFSSYTQQKAWKNKLEMPLILDFPIGTFDVTGSREDIIYNNETIAKIRTHIDNVFDDLAKLCQDKMDKAKTFAESNQIYSELNNVFGNFSHILGKVHYKSWKESKWRNMIQSKRLGLNNRISFKPTVKGSYGYGAGNFRSNEMTTHDLYSRFSKMTYVILDPYDKGGKVRLRLRNFFETLEKSGIRCHNSNVLWIKTKPKDNLNRLKAILPKNHLFIDIDDIEPAKVERTARESSEDTSFRLRRCDILGCRLTTGHYTVKDESYFIRITKRKMDEDNRKVLDAVNILGLGLEEVHAIPKTAEYMIEEHDLIDLFEAAEQARATIEYDEDAYYYNAILHLKLDDKNPNAKKFYKDWIPHYESHICKDKALLYMVGWPHKIPIDTTKVSKFVKDVNPTVEAKFNSIYDAMIAKFDKLYEDHKALKFVSEYSLRGSTHEILIDLGEMKE